MADSAFSTRRDALTLLARKRDAIHRANFERFARQVRDSVDGSILRYSKRRSLIRAAAGRRISRFDANLIIAAVQHRIELDAPSPFQHKSSLAAAVHQRPATRSDDGEAVCTSDTSSAATLALQIFAAQGMIFTAAWWVLRGLW